MSMGRRRVVVGESVVEDRQEDEVEAHSPSKRGRRRGSAGKGVSGQTACAYIYSGTAGMPGDGQRRLTSSGRSG